MGKASLLYVSIYQMFFFTLWDFSLSRIWSALTHQGVYIMQKTILGQNIVNMKIYFKHRNSTQTKRTEQVKKIVFLQPPCILYI